MANADFLILGRRIKMLGLGTVLLTTGFLFETCTSSGNVSIFLAEYNNPYGYLADGNQCNDTACDHYFIMCLDQLNGSVSNISQCSLGKYTTEPTTGKNRIFNNTIKPNPENIPFDKWLGGALLKVEVRDNKTHPRNNLVDFLSTSLNIKANGSRKIITMQTFQPKRKSNTTLHLEIRAFCNENWYGPKCDFYCKPTNDKNTHICRNNNEPNVYTYYVNTTTTTSSLEEAQEICQERNMTLLTIENEEVSEIINSHFHKEPMWLDYKTKVYEKPKWLNGTDVAVVKSNPAAAQCAYLCEGLANAVLMKTENCNETNKFICSWTNDSYPHINYVLNDDLSTWFEAREKCKEIGSDLYLPMEIQTFYFNYTDKYWIGASNFACFTGNHKRATYTPWAEDQPTVTDKKECVVRTPRGNWRTRRCNIRKSFTVICQKETTSPNNITQLVKSQTPEVTRGTTIKHTVSTSSTVETTSPNNITQLLKSQTPEVTRGTTIKHTVSTSSTVETTSPNDIHSDQMATIPAESQSTGAGQGSKMSNFTLGAAVGSTVFGLVLVITGIIIWKFCQKKRKQDQDVAPLQNGTAMCDMAESVNQQCVVPDDHVYYDIDENPPQNGAQDDEGLYEDPDRKDAADVCSVSDDENKIEGHSSSRNSMESVTSEVVLQDNEIYN